MLRGENKITASHRRRTCLVYVRQSTMAQVRGNTESTARQYGLAGEAARLGWAASDIEVIDADLGLSGRSADNRTGFKEVVARVCLGEVGAIFGLEVSRLARSNADLAKLLELARLTETWSSTPTASTTWPTIPTGSSWGSRAKCQKPNSTSCRAACRAPNVPPRSAASSVPRSPSAMWTTRRQRR